MLYQSKYVVTATYLKIENSTTVHR